MKKNIYYLNLLSFLIASSCFAENVSTKEYADKIMQNCTISSKYNNSITLVFTDARNAIFASYDYKTDCDTSWIKSTWQKNVKCSTTVPSPIAHDESYWWGESWSEAIKCPGPRCSVFIRFLRMNWDCPENL